MQLGNQEMKAKLAIDAQVPQVLECPASTSNGLSESTIYCVHSHVFPPKLQLLGNVYLGPLRALPVI